MKPNLNHFKIILMIAAILTVTFAQVPSVYSTELTAKANVVSFLQEVLQIDMPKYEATLTTYQAGSPSYYGGLKEEICRTELTSTESNIDVVYTLVNGTLVSCNLNLLNDLVFYAKEQPSATADFAKNFIQKYQQHTGASYVEPMSKMIDEVDTQKNMTITSGNLKLEVWINEYITDFNWIYTDKGIDFPQKGFSIHFKNGEFEGFGDGWTLYKVGNIDAISKDDAINIAMERAKNYTTYVSADSNNWTEVKPNIVTDRVDATLNGLAREPLTLYPAWDIQLYFDKVYQTQDGLQIRIWADTKEIQFFLPTSHGGSQLPQNQQTEPLPTPSLTNQPNTSLQPSVKTENNIAPLDAGIAVAITGVAIILIATVIIKKRSK